MSATNPSVTACQLLFSQGFGTRRACEALIAAGALAIDGRVIAEPQTELLLHEGQPFEVGGERWPYQPRALIALHKPAGYECSQRPGRYPSVMTLLPPPLRQRGMQPVGRLDADTTGLLLLTDDGALLHRLTSPRHHVPKRYRVTCTQAITTAQVQALLAGVVLRDDPKPVRASACLRITEQVLELTITQGKYHQVKRMLAAVGNRVQALHRCTIGGLALPDELASGHWCWLDGSARAALLQRD